MSNASGDYVIGTYIAQDSFEAAKPAGSVRVPDGYTLTGGGARLYYRGEGVLLTSSYPGQDPGSPPDAPYTEWRASGSSHQRLDSGTVLVFAIGLVICKPSGEPIPIRQSVDISTTKVPFSNVTGSVCSSGAMTTGGGARILREKGMKGSFLTGSYPMMSGGKPVGWMASGTDHIVASPTTIEVFTISITIPELGRKCRLQWASASTKSGSDPRIQVMSPPAPEGWSSVLVGGGAYVTSRGEGNLLFASHPEMDARGEWTEWVGMGKEHIHADPSGIMNGWAITLELES